MANVILNSSDSSGFVNKKNVFKDQLNSSIKQIDENNNENENNKTKDTSKSRRDMYLPLEQPSIKKQRLNALTNQSNSRNNFNTLDTPLATLNTPYEEKILKELNYQLPILNTPLTPLFSSSLMSPSWNKHFGLFGDPSIGLIDPPTNRNYYSISSPSNNKSDYTINKSDSIDRQEIKSEIPNNEQSLVPINSQKRKDDDHLVREAIKSKNDESKKAKNREAASRCRQRKLERMKLLENQSRALEAQNYELNSANMNLKSRLNEFVQKYNQLLQEYDRLRNQMYMHHQNGCILIDHNHTKSLKTIQSI